MPGIEPGSPAWQAGILTTILQRLDWKFVINLLSLISNHVIYHNMPLSRSNGCERMKISYQSPTHAIPIPDLDLISKLKQ